MNVLLIYPEFPDTYWSFKHALKFVSKKVSSPPLGLLTVASLLPGNWQKRLIDMNAQTLQKSDIDWADLVFISAMIVQKEAVRSLIKRVKGARKILIAGGPLFTAEPEKFLDVDHLILNEAELSLPQFINDFQIGCAQQVYSSTGFSDITLTPTPEWDLLEFKYYDSMSIQFSRGCPYHCEFCDVTVLFGHTPRIKTAKQLIKELDGLYQRGWRRNIFFVDDNFIGNKKVLKEDILPALIQWRKDKIGCLFLTEASINLADDDELINLMVQAGFYSVFIGIETPDETSLNECNKKQNQKRDLLGSIKKLQRAGLQVMGGFIVGFDSDTPDIFDRQVEFIQQSGILTAMVGLLNALPGTALYSRLSLEGRILEESSGNNVSGQTNFQPKMDPAILHGGYMSILTRIYSPEFFYQRIKTFLSDFRPARPPVTLEVAEFLAFFRAIWILGVLGKERKYFWNLLVWSLLNNFQTFPLAVTFAIYGHHFRIITNQLTKTWPVHVVATKHPSSIKVQPSRRIVFRP